MTDHTAHMDPVAPDPMVTRVATPVPQESPGDKKKVPLAGEVQVERPRSHPLTYLALALGSLALILSLAALTRGNGPDYRQVKIGANDCVIGAQDGQDVLYCRTASVP
ncbi:MAG: hypothetical protein JWO68_3084 [Actinomycetia bacterium]|nr:hypothetical protein [Actinomycetes bacterium]